MRFVTASQLAPSRVPPPQSSVSACTAPTTYTTRTNKRARQQHTAGWRVCDCHSVNASTTSRANNDNATTIAKHRDDADDGYTCSTVTVPTQTTTTTTTTDPMSANDERTKETNEGTNEGTTATTAMTTTQRTNERTNNERTNERTNEASKPSMRW